MAVNYNDIDYCLKVRQDGYRVVFAPQAELFHFESKSRPGGVSAREMSYFGRLWRGKVKEDPFYNRNLEPDPAVFEVRTGW
jgi:GT2 family glycosyltransferase